MTRKAKFKPMRKDLAACWEVIEVLVTALRAAETWRVDVTCSSDVTALEEVKREERYHVLGDKIDAALKRAGART